MRMLMNNLDPDVAERPEDLVVYGGTGKAARSWEAYDAIVRTLRTLGDDETLLVQSGKPVGVFRTHEMAPRVLDLELDARAEVGDVGHVPRARGRRAHDVRADDRGLVDLHRDPGDPAGDVRDLRRVRATQRFGGSLAGHRDAHRRSRRDGRRATARRDDERGRRPLRRGRPGAHRAAHQDAVPRSRDATTSRRRCAWVDEARVGRARRSRSGCVGNCAEVLPELLARGFAPELVTDQTSAHDPLGGYVPAGLSLEEAASAARRTIPPSTSGARTRRWRGTSRRWSGSWTAARSCSTTATTCGPAPRLGGLAHERAYAYPGFVPAFVRPLFCEGKGPFRWAALSGDPEDIAKTDRAVAELFPDDERLHRWLEMAEERVAFQGLPARICWLGYGERAKAGLRFNEMVASGELSAPIVIGRDHLDSGSVAEPVPRDRGDEGRLRRDRGLADPERAGEHRGRRALGERAPRRRRRDRVLDPRRDGRGRRRQRERARRGSSAC